MPLCFICMQARSQNLNFWTECIDFQLHLFMPKKNLKHNFVWQVVADKTLCRKLKKVGPGWHQQSPCPPSVLQMLKRYSPGNHSTSDTSSPPFSNWGTKCLGFIIFFLLFSTALLLNPSLEFLAETQPLSTVSGVLSAQLTLSPTPFGKWKELSNPVWGREG